jgi:hypothetical protein
MDRSTHPILAALAGGLAAGALDIVSALLLTALRGRDPVVVLHYIASGVLGRDAFPGTPTIAALGLALHFFITCVAAGLYVAASRRMPALALQPLRFGAAYGVVVWAVMHLVVVPLSAVPGAMTFTLQGVATQLAIHVACVGWPIALAAARFAPPGPRGAAPDALAAAG